MYISDKNSETKSAQIIEESDIQKNITYPNSKQIIIEYLIEKLGYVSYDNKLYTVDKFIEIYHS